MLSPSTNIESERDLVTVDVIESAMVTESERFFMGTLVAILSVTNTESERFLT